MILWNNYKNTELNTGFNTKYRIDLSTLKSICNVIISGESFGSMFEESSQYINSVYLYPFNIRSLYSFTGAERDEKVEKIKIGNIITEYDGAPLNSEDNPMYNYSCYGYYYFKAYRNDFTDLLGKYNLKLPYMSELIELNINILYKRVLFLCYSVDINSGQITYYLCLYDTQYESEDKSGLVNFLNDIERNIQRTRVIATYSTPCSIKIPIGSNSASAQDLKLATEQNKQISSGIGAGLGIVGAIGNILTGNAGGAISSLVKSASGGIETGINAKNSILESQVNTLQKGDKFTSGVNNFYNDECYIQISRPNINENFDYTNYKKYVGAPLAQTRLLKNLSGFTLCRNFHLENFDTATKQELEMLDNTLRSGIIL